MASNGKLHEIRRTGQGEKVEVVSRAALVIAIGMEFEEPPVTD